MGVPEEEIDVCYLRFLNYSNKLTNLNKIYNLILIRNFYGYIISELHCVKKGQNIFIRIINLKDIKFNASDFKY